MPPKKKGKRSPPQNVTKSSPCKFLKKHCLFFIGLLIIIGIVILIICLTRTKNHEMFTENDDDGDGPSMVMFYAPWCGYCKKIKPTWEELESAGVLNSKEVKVKIKSIDCDENKELAKKHNVDGFPTIKYFPDGMKNTSSAIVYDGERTLPGFKDFINNQ